MTSKAFVIIAASKLAKFCGLACGPKNSRTSSNKTKLSRQDFIADVYYAFVPPPTVDPTRLLKNGICLISYTYMYFYLLRSSRSLVNDSAARLTPQFTRQPLKIFGRRCSLSNYKLSPRKRERRISTQVSRKLAVGICRPQSFFVEADSVLRVSKFGRQTCRRYLACHGVIRCY